MWSLHTAWTGSSHLVAGLPTRRVPNRNRLGSDLLRRKPRIACLYMASRQLRTGVRRFGLACLTFSLLGTPRNPYSCDAMARNQRPDTRQLSASRAVGAICEPSSMARTTCRGGSKVKAATPAHPMGRPLPPRLLAHHRQRAPSGAAIRMLPTSAQSAATLCTIRHHNTSPLSTATAAGKRGRRATWPRQACTARHALCRRSTPAATLNMRWTMARIRAKVGLVNMARVEDRLGRVLALCFKGRPLEGWDRQKGRGAPTPLACKAAARAATRKPVWSHAFPRAVETAEEKMRVTRRGEAGRRTEPKRRRFLYSARHGQRTNPAASGHILSDWGFRP